MRDKLDDLQALGVNAIEFMPWTAWPGSAFSASIGKVVGPTTMDISATDLTWEFFQRFQLA